MRDSPSASEHVYEKYMLDIRHFVDILTYGDRVWILSISLAMLRQVGGVESEF